MITNPKKSEQGQAIIYLVLGLVVFFGFVALAIDGGMALADRRHAQNAADAASLAGGGQAADALEQGVQVCVTSWTCGNNAGDAIAHAYSAAIQRADTNNFNIDNDISDNNGVHVDCSTAGKYLDVTVDISATTTSNFLQLVFPSALHNEVQAVTRVYPPQPIILDNTVIALNPASCATAGNGVTMNGNGDTTVLGGDIFSNGCIRGAGAAGTVTVDQDGIAGHDIRLGNMSWDPAPVYTSTLIQPSDYFIQAPTCTVWYNGYGALPKDSSKRIPSGLYCMSGDLNLQQDLYGDGVTFYLPHGKVVNNGNAILELSAPSEDPADPGYPPAPPAITGVLFYVANGGSVTLDGTADDIFHGMIYAPQSDIKLTGNADNIFYGQVIGWNVQIGGTNNMTVDFDKCKSYTRPASIELFK